MSKSCLELLAPAKNLECGIAAIDHGADAVYIGAERFGARAAAGNNIDDIRQLCDYARPFGVKVYVTVNTLLHDDELETARQLIWQVYEAGADAILVQDLRLLNMDLPPIALHASTQTDNRTAEKVRALRDAGFSRVVLARELSVSEIAAIHQAVPDVELESFVHGALCVSYSGQCYASEYCFGRSANRGECAQFCRMKFDLVDADGTVIIRDRYLLSLKDMNRLDRLQQLISSGIVSFKIEGRLKDVCYVKNVTAAYNQQLDDIVRRNSDRYCRASLGHCRYTFTPDLAKTFNRGYTHYFLDGRTSDIASFLTPKAIGEYVGTVKDIRRDSFRVSGTARFANGDGLCFFTRQGGSLQGFRVNRAEGNRLYPYQMPRGLCLGLPLYRNNDIEFERQLSRPSAERKIPVTLSLRAIPDGFQLTGNLLGQGETVVATIIYPHQLAEASQRENIIRQLTKLGGTPYECVSLDLPADFPYFIPVSQLAALRREWVKKTIFQPLLVERGAYSAGDNNSPPSQGGAVEEPSVWEGLPLMQCRHCLRYALGYCTKLKVLSRDLHEAPEHLFKAPFYLRLGDGRRFRLEFDCHNCQMNVYAACGLNE